MAHMNETRRAGERERASEAVLWRNGSEDTAAPISLQAAFVASRFGIGGPLARAVAELAFRVEPRR